MDRRKWMIVAGIVALLLVVFLFVQKPLRELVNRQLLSWNKPKAELVLHRLCHYADSVGIDTTRYAFVATDSKEKIAEKMEHLLLEIRYGLRPSTMTYCKVPEKIDTTWAVKLLGNEEKPMAVIDSLKSAQAFSPYAALVNQYRQLRGRTSGDSMLAIRRTLNFYRYLNRFETDRFVVVNIPAAELNVYDRTGKRLMPMEVIAGKKDNPTPCFTSFLTDIIAYPYWNVPQGIAVKELLPKIQADPGFLDSQNLQILDARSQEVDPTTIDWASMSADNFPYRIRQSSGCHNALGLIKFNLTGPGAIYLHDTNARNLFSMTTDRWRSHGCVRLEKPVEFANFLLGTPKFDAGFYDRCLLDQKPQNFKLAKRVPVFVVYNTADVKADGKLAFYKDIYAVANPVR